VIVFEDEASFQQTPTLRATWARRASSASNSHARGAPVSLDGARFTYLHQQEYFQWETYLAFVEQVLVPTFYRRNHRVYLIQDNASYHKKQESRDWFAKHQRYIQVFPLPPYWPELNATERIWKYTRQHATHNRFFAKPEHLCQALFRTFEHARRHPEEIASLLQSFN
jgi:transposase